MVGYYAIFMVYLFAFTKFENEFLHYVTLVFLPLSMLYMTRKSINGECSYRQVLRSIGLSKAKLRQGLGAAFLLGCLLIMFDLGLQVLFADKSPFAQLIYLARTGKIVLALPLSFLVMFFTAGFTEEVFFRGILQTHLATRFKSDWLAITATSVMFGLYHIPYLLMQGFSDGGVLLSIFGRVVDPALAGLLFGYAYNRYRNLMVPIIMHSMVNMLFFVMLVR